MSLGDIAQSFSVQTESLNNYAYLANPNVASASTFLTAVYANLFNRAPDTAGLNYWTTQLSTGKSTVGNAILNIISGAVDTPASGSTAATLDASTLANKMAAGLSWAQTMSNIAGAVYGVNEAASAKSIVASVTSDAATVTAAATSTASFFANGGAAPGQSFALTTGIDAIVAAGNTTVNAVDGATANTWSALDTIAGKGGNNSLNIASGYAISQPAGATVAGIQTVTVAESAANANVTLSTGSWTGLAALNVTQAGTGVDTLTAGSAVNVTNTGASTGAVLVYGGNNVTVTSAGGAVTVGSAANNTKANAAGNISITDTAAATAAILVDGGVNQTVAVTGANVLFATTAQVTSGVNTAATGIVTVSETTATGGATNGKITIKGGSSVVITEAAGDTVQAAGVANSTDVMGAVAVTGNASTTTVSVTQAAAASAATAVTALFGVSAVTAVTAAAGVEAKAGVAAVTAADAVTGKIGVTAGTVDINDMTATNSTTATAAGKSGGTISSVTLNNYGAANISSPVLNTLTLSGVGGALGLYEGGTASVANTTLTLNVNNLSGTNDITDNGDGTNALFKTINVVTGAAKSSISSITDTALTNLNVSGSSLLTMTNATSATSIAVTGAAGYKGAINSTTTTFDASGSTGASTITINADATKVIKGGSGSADEIVADFNGFTAAKTGAKVTGFEILGITTNTGTQDASAFGSGITSIDVSATAITSVLSKVNQGTSISFSAAATTTTALTVGYADVQGATDAITVTLAGPTASKATTGAVQTVTSLTLADANGIGIGTLNLVDNNVAANYNGDVITALVDNNVSTMNFSGVGGLQVSSAAANFLNAATAMTIGNTGTNAAGLTVTMTDNSLGSLTFTGSGKTVVNLTDTVAGTVVLTNSGTGSVTLNAHNATVAPSGDLVAANVTLVGKMTADILDNNVTSLTLSDGQAVKFFDTNTGGVTISGAADNSHVELTLTGATTAKTDTITLGNANNVIADTSAATTATVNITVGTGLNKITVGTGLSATDSVYNITLGAHTGAEAIYANNSGGANYATVMNNVITGALTGDKIYFADTASTATGTLTPLATVASANSEASAITALITGVDAVGAHNAAYGVYNGNTYFAEESAAAGAATVTLVKIVGVHTMSATNDAGAGGFDYIKLLS